MGVPKKSLFRPLIICSCTKRGQLRPSALTYQNIIGSIFKFVLWKLNIRKPPGVPGQPLEAAAAFLTQLDQSQFWYMHGMSCTV